MRLQLATDDLKHHKIVFLVIRAGAYPGTPHGVGGIVSIDGKISSDTIIILIIMVALYRPLLSPNGNALTTNERYKEYTNVKLKSSDLTRFWEIGQ